jgi:hypothetical protein
LRQILAILCFILLLSCNSSDPKTYITDKPLMIDSSNFSTIAQKFHYENIDTPSNFLGGLTPRLAIAEVYKLGFTDNCIWTSQGMLPACYSLVAKTNDSLILIDTEERFKQVFLPIDNEQEAISYVAYLTRAYPEYDIPKELRYRVFSSYFPSTYSKRVSGGFEVLLHDKKVFGCGPHPNFYKRFKVTDGGEIRLLQTVKMFEDPEEDGMCVD